MSSEPTPNPVELPSGLAAYGHSPEFTEASVPAALLADHNTRAGSWGLIHVREGRLTYRITDPRRAADARVLIAGDPPGIVEPTILHHVELDGPVRFQVEFLRAG